MKITDVEAIWLRLPEIDERCDGTQDTLLVCRCAKTPGLSITGHTGAPHPCGGALEAVSGSGAPGEVVVGRAGAMKMVMGELRSMVSLGAFRASLIRCGVGLCLRSYSLATTAPVATTRDASTPITFFLARMLKTWKIEERKVAPLVVNDKAAHGSQQCKSGRYGYC